MMPDFHSNPYGDRRFFWVTQAPTSKVIETPGECVIFTREGMNWIRPEFSLRKKNKSQLSGKNIMTIKIIN